MQVAGELDAGDPRIWVSVEDVDTIIGNAHELHEEDEAVAANRLKATLTT